MELECTKALYLNEEIHDVLVAEKAVVDFQFLRYGMS